MYAVIHGNGLIYLGSDLPIAIKHFESKVGSQLHNIESVKDLHQFGVTVYENSNTEPLRFDNDYDFMPIDGQAELAQNLSDAAKEVFNRLDDLGLDDMAASFVESTGTMFAQVSHIGTKGMETVGEGFIAIGDILSAATENIGD